jgi:hypothetical protein
MGLTNAVKDLVDLSSFDYPKKRPSVAGPISKLLVISRTRAKAGKKSNFRQLILSTIHEIDIENVTEPFRDRHMRNRWLG